MTQKVKPATSVTNHAQRFSASTRQVGKHACSDYPGLVVAAQVLLFAFRLATGIINKRANASNVRLSMLHQ